MGGGPEMAPNPPKARSAPGKPVALLDHALPVLDADDLGDERGALPALDLDGRLGGHAKAVAIHRLDVLQLERAQPDARTRRHGVREPHLVAAVVQTALAAGDFE